MSVVEFRWHGRGGQGAVTAAKLLAAAALREGRHIQSFPDYGAERRGAPVRAFTRISDAPIKTTASVLHPDVIAVLDPTLLTAPAIFEGLTPTSQLVTATDGKSGEALRTLLPSQLTRAYAVPADMIARETLGRPITNTALLGAVVRATELVRLESVLAEVSESFAADYGPSLAAKNALAIERAYEATVAIPLEHNHGTPIGSSAMMDLRPPLSPASHREFPDVMGGSARSYLTGDWRSQRPIFDAAKCVQCFACWRFCPDSCILTAGGPQAKEASPRSVNWVVRAQMPRWPAWTVAGVDYEFCKGCGICADRCPTGALTMERV